MNWFEKLMVPAVVLLSLGIAASWCWNIVKLAQLGSDHVGMVVLRAFGILFVPLGVVLGWV